MRLSLEMDVYEELLNVSFEDIKVQSTLMASLFHPRSHIEFLVDVPGQVSIGGALFTICKFLFN